MDLRSAMFLTDQCSYMSRGLITMHAIAAKGMKMMAATTRQVVLN